MIIAQQTLDRINNAIARDNGNTFRYWLGRVLPTIGDAYRADEDAGFRSHLGASIVGHPCERNLYYGFRWANLRTPDGRHDEGRDEGQSRMLRLFNRGHLEEARFIAMLLTAGIHVNSTDADGNQIRISEYGGHFGSAIDSELFGVPEIPNEVIAGEFKTHNAKNFAKLQVEGVRIAKPEHNVQMQTYMHKRGYRACLYLAVNKDDDTLHAEIVDFDPNISTWYLNRAARVIFGPKPPRIRQANPGFWTCNFCDYKDVCFGAKVPLRNCRTCEFSQPLPDGTWRCNQFSVLLDKDAQVRGCERYTLAKQLSYV